MNKQLLAWIVFALARGVAWFLVAKLGMDAKAADSLAGEIANAAGALAVAGFTVWTSIHGRKTILATMPPPAIDLAPLMMGVTPPAEFLGNGMGVPGTQAIIRKALWWAQDVQADMDRLAARWHDWGYLTGGRPTYAEIEAWRASYAVRGRAVESSREFFAGGDEDSKRMVDGWLAMNTLTILDHRWPRWKYLLLNRLYMGAVFDAVRDLGDKAFNWKNGTSYP